MIECLWMRHRRMVRAVVGVVVSIGVWAVAVGMCRAQGLAYEGFDGLRTGAPIAGSNGGSGFGGAWYDAGQESVHLYAEESLSYYTLAVEGGRLTAGSVTSPIAWVQRSLAAPLGYVGSTVYVSFLLRPEGRLHAGGFNGFFGLYLNTGVNLFLGKPGGGAVAEYVMEDVGGTNQHSTQEPVLIDQTAFLVLKIEFGTSEDVFTLYVNPPPVPVEPAGGVVRTDHPVSQIDGLTVYSTGAFSLDEIRVGWTYADVAPFQDPALVAKPLEHGLEFSWDAPGFRLEQALGLGPDVPWTAVIGGDQSPATINPPASGAVYFRLKIDPGEALRSP